MTNRNARTLIVAALIVASGCVGKINTTRFVNSDFDFGFVETVAVLPLENLSEDRQAGERATRILITELLASGAVDVVEPGEVKAALSRLPGNQTTPSTEDIVTLGKALAVQALIQGSVTQSGVVRSGTASVPVVTLDLHMLETETGAPVWAATQTERGSGASAKVWGTGTEPLSQTTRRCVRKSIKSLVK